jgi:hypothetical protein
MLGELLLATPAVLDTLAAAAAAETSADRARLLERALSEDPVLA